MSQWIDLSIAVDENIPSFNDVSPFSRIIRKSVDKGDGYNESWLDIGCHSATHVDAPYHFNNNGKRIHQLDLDLLMGECYVVEIFNKSIITYNDLCGLNIPEGTKRLIIKTDNTTIGFEPKFRKDFVGLDVSAVKFFDERGILLVGTDYLAISKYDQAAAVHTAFFENNERIALEALYLNDVCEGKYELICLPIKLKDADGAPARVVARRLDV